MEILFSFASATGEGAGNKSATVGKSDANGRAVPLGSPRRRIVSSDRPTARSWRENLVRRANKAVPGRIFHALDGRRPRPSRRRGGERQMSRVAAVALNTFREAVRDRVLYNLVFFALLMMGAAIIVGSDLDRHRADGHRQPGPERHLRSLDYSWRYSSASAWCPKRWTSGRFMRSWQNRCDAGNFCVGKFGGVGVDLVGEYRGDGSGIVSGAVTMCAILCSARTLACW